LLGCVAIAARPTRRRIYKFAASVEWLVIVLMNAPRVPGKLDIRRIVRSSRDETVQSARHFTMPNSAVGNHNFESAGIG